MIRLDTCCIRIFADGRIPGAKHERRLVPDVIETSWDPTERSCELVIEAAQSWTTPDAMVLGPERVLWQNLHGKKILDSKHFPRIRFVGRLDGDHTLAGTLEVRGTALPVRGSCRLEKQDESVLLSGVVPLHLSDWGIKRFKALLGTIWLLDDAQVEFALRAPAALF